MKQRLRSLMLATVIMSSLTVLADDSQDYVRITTAEDSEVFVLLSDKPCVTVESQQVKVSTESEELLFGFNTRPKFEIVNGLQSDVKKFTDSQVLVKYSGDTLTIEGLNADDNVQVFDIGGALIAGSRADAIGRWSSSVASWPSGVYIVKSKELTTKIIKK